MRVSSVLALLVLACAAFEAQGAEQAADQSNVTVNFDALPVPMPRPKPSPDEMRPLAQARPRPKPEIESAMRTGTLDEAVPRPKPELELARMPVASPAEPPAPVMRPAQPPDPPAVPVTIVSKPTTDDTFPVEITGVAEDPNASRKPVNPIEGFAVLSRVRFSRGKSEIPVQAQATLDILAQRLRTSRERVRLAAFSGKAGADSSEARRLSLARALAIRTYLVSKGVPIERVDVLAFGGAIDGVTDRVDVLVRGI